MELTYTILFALCLIRSSEGVSISQTLWANRLMNSPIQLQMHHEFLLKNVTCDHNALITENVTCGLDNVNGRNPSMWLNVWFYPNVTASTVLVKLTIEYRRRDEKAFSIFMGIKNMTIDICKVFEGVTHSILVDIILKDLQTYSNIVHSCPFRVSAECESLSLQIFMIYVEIYLMIYCRFRDMYTCVTSQWVIIWCHLNYRSLSTLFDWQSPPKLTVDISHFWVCVYMLIFSI